MAGTIDQPGATELNISTQGVTTGESLDLRGFRCPVPVIRLEAALRRLSPGVQITVLADDPVAAVDIPYFCQAGGHQTRRLPDQGENGEICVFRVTCGPKLAP